MRFRCDSKYFRGGGSENEMRRIIRIRMISYAGAASVRFLPLLFPAVSFRKDVAN